jgi:hypothetical protein
LRSLSLNNVILWTVVLMFCGLPITPIDYWTISLCFARVLEWMAVISIVRTSFHRRRHLCLLYFRALTGHPRVHQ